MPDRARGRVGAVRDTIGAITGAVLGLAPHVLDHVGLIAGTAFVAGAGGNALFYAVGLLLSVPMLRRIHRRFGTWIAPAVAVAVFTAMFLLSAVVVGPAITSTPAPRSGPLHAPRRRQRSTRNTTPCRFGNPSPQSRGSLHAGSAR